MKLEKMINPAFQQAMRELNSQKLPIKAAFMLSQITEKMEQEIERFETVKLDSIRKSGIKDDKGELIPDANGNVTLSPEDSERITKELKEALDQDIDMPVVNLSDLGNNLSISVTELSLLKDIISLTT